MSQILKPITATLFMVLMAGGVSAQLIPNPKLSPLDLAAARSEARKAGGDQAELIYATRIDGIEKGKFNTLVVIYARPAKEGKDYYGLIVADSKKYPLSYDQEGRALRSGDRFLRIGLRHQAGQPPLLRLISATSEVGRPGEWQRNLDFQFNGTSFALLAQSVVPLAR